MATYFKIDSRLWHDARFRGLSTAEKLDELQGIVFGAPHRYRGPRFRIATTAKRRPDLYSAAWRSQRSRIIAIHGAVCAYCGCDCADDPTVDHKVPVSEGGTNEDANLVVACRSCNGSKGAKTMEEFLRDR